MLNKKTISVLEKFSSKMLPVLESIYFVDGKVYTSNYKNFCIAKVQGKEQDFAVNIKDFKKVISRTELDHISLSSSDKVSLTSGKKVFNFSPYTEDLIKIPEIRSQHIGLLEITKEILGLRNFIDKGEFMPNLQGLHWSSKNSEFVATDAHILKTVKTDIKPSKDLILDEVVFNIPEGIYDVYESEEYITFESKDFIFIIKEIDNRYPDYKSVIPRDFTQKLEVGYKYFVDCLNDALICANTMTFKGVIKGDILSSENEENSSFQCELMASRKSNFPFAFNIKYMLSVLKEIRDSDIVTIDLVGENRAMIINRNTLLFPLMIEN